MRPACPIAIESGVQPARRDISANSPDGELSLEPLPSRSAGDRRSGRLGFPLDLHQEWARCFTAHAPSSNCQVEASQVDGSLRNALDASLQHGDCLVDRPVVWALPHHPGGGPADVWTTANRIAPEVHPDQSIPGLAPKLYNTRKG